MGVINSTLFQASLGADSEAAVELRANEALTSDERVALADGVALSERAGDAVHRGRAGDPADGGRQSVREKKR